MISAARVIAPATQPLNAPVETRQRAARKMPAFTMAAACRKAEAGVGATMAEGSHVKNGTCAALPQAATRSSVAKAARPAGVMRATASKANEPVCA